MKPTFVDKLACPASGHPLMLEAHRDGDDIETGRLLCTGCPEQWAITRGVPRLVPSDLHTEQERTSAAFGWQWQHFSELHPEFEAQFLDWLHPIGPESFDGKRVLDAGCGNGRHARLAAQFGAREVVALDLSAAVDAAKVNVADIDNVEVVQGDLLRPPLRTAADGGGFDLIYSIGVLHHLPDPRAGFMSLLRFLRPGGAIAVWVYGYENNGLVRNVVEPLRRVSTRIPTSGLRFLAWPLAVGFHGLARFVHAPLQGRALARNLPLHEYLASVGHFTFRQNYGIVFDQLAAPTAAYLRRCELEQWLDDALLVDARLSHRHGNSWRLRGTMAERPEAPR